jgi:hypothetical protein
LSIISWLTSTHSETLSVPIRPAISCAVIVVTMCFLENHGAPRKCHYGPPGASLHPTQYWKPAQDVASTR